jgi:iron(III) transport system ATP-binding protein
MAVEPIIELHNLRKQYGADIQAVDDVSLAVERGQLLALLGPSGCGKSTMLRLIAGLETPDSGEVWLEGNCAAGPRAWLPPEARRVGMVFQDYALFPHLTVRQNILFPLNGMRPRERQPRVAAMLELVGLASLDERYPHQLSGGQQQRVALARALAPNPAVVLLDEPFSNLDVTLRNQMRDEVRQILQSAGATTLFVTHDQEEAFALADTVAVMFAGELAQVGTPRMIYLYPVSREVAAFVGEANFLAGTADGNQVTCALGRLPPAVSLHGRVDVLVRPEALLLQPDPAGAARVEQVTFSGRDQTVQLALHDGTRLRARSSPLLELNPGMQVHPTVQGPVMAYSL